MLVSLIDGLKGLLATIPDQRTGENTVYDMAGIGLAAFATLFIQSPSFLAQQTAPARGGGTSNCQTLFQIARVPTDNCIRELLDPVTPGRRFPMFPVTPAVLVAGGGPAPFQRLCGHVLIALDGTSVFPLAETLVSELFVAQACQRQDGAFSSDGFGRHGRARA